MHDKTKPQNRMPDRLYLIMSRFGGWAYTMTPEKEDFEKSIQKLKAAGTFSQFRTAVYRRMPAEDLAKELKKRLRGEE